MSRSFASAVNWMVQSMMLLLPGYTNFTHLLWIKQIQNGNMNDSILEDFYLLGI